jgi:tetratricopeptide (TPR) repeat protein
VTRFVIFVFIILFTNISSAIPYISNSITPVSYFMNHVKELTFLENKLSSYKTASVVGISGIGKTQFVRIYAKENKNRYKVIWFIDCNLDINEEFAKLAKAINSQSKQKLLQEKGIEVLQEVMEYLSTKQDWLLVLDNIKAYQNKELTDLIMWEHNGHVIFSSQSSELLPNAIKLKPLKEHESKDLVLNLLDERNEDIASFFAKEFKGYPVLIVQGVQLFNKIKGLKRQEYKRKIYEADDKIKFNIELAINILPKTARDLLFQISLINNQSFSKKFLKHITSSKEDLNNDLYELSKYMIITNIDANEENPVFEMHDIIATKVQEIIGKERSKVILENIISKLIKSMPEGVHDGHIFRTSKTVHENFEIISNNLEKYNPKILTKMGLNLYLLTDYLNTASLKKAKPLVNWFEKIRDDELNTDSMSQYEKYIYIRYLGIVGFYYRLSESEHKKAINYYSKAMKLFDSIKGYNDIRNNTVYQIATSHIALGNLDQAQTYISQMESMYKNGIVSESEIGLLHLVRAKYYFSVGEYRKALLFVNKDIEDSKSHGLDQNNKLFTSTYLLKAKILNHLNFYKDSLSQLMQLKKMYEDSKESDEILVYIYSQMAKSLLGQNQIKKAQTYIIKATEKLSLNEDIKQGSLKFSRRVEYAEVYAIYADILSKKKNYKDALSYYEIAEAIYQNAYMGNVNKISDIKLIYKEATQTSCKAKDLFWYKHFYRELQNIIQDNSDVIIKETDKICKVIEQ